MRNLKSWVSLIAVLVFVFFCLHNLWAADAQKININTASAAELMNLKGIGEKKAKAIIEIVKPMVILRNPKISLKFRG